MGPVGFADHLSVTKTLVVGPHFRADASGNYRAHSLFIHLNR